LLLRQDVLLNQQAVKQKVCFFLLIRQKCGMNSPALQFREWMDARKLKAKDVSQRFGVSIQTIGHWRSQGVPKTKIPHVNYVISCWTNPTAAEIGSTLLLKPSSAQFREWNLAALQNRQLLEEWAIEGLDKYAAELVAEESPAADLSTPPAHLQPVDKVAEDETPYRTNGGKA
jgi:hypothetical protein